MPFKVGIIILVSICSFVCTAAQEANGNTQCANDLIQWCGNMKKPPNFVGNFMTTDYSSNGERQIVHCIAGTGGTNCTLNNSPWYACRPDGSVMYKNSVLRENSPAPDDGICEASRKARNMFTYDSAKIKAKLDAGRRKYERAMQEMNSKLNIMQRKLSRPCFPFCSNDSFRRRFLEG